MLRSPVALAALLMLASASGAQTATPLRTLKSGIVFVAFDFPGAVATRGIGINNKAEIVGSYDDDQSRTIGFFMSAQGEFRRVDPKHTGFSEAYGINDASVIVGTFDPGPQLGFAFDGSKYYPVEYGAEINFASGINRFRDIVGVYADVCCDLHGFLLRKGQVTTIDYPGAEITAAENINDAGVIVGVWRDTSGVHHGFRCDGDAFTSIDVPGAVHTYAAGINSAETIVGFYLDSNGAERGFVLNHGAFQSVDVPGAFFTELTGINDMGIIVGDYADVNGVQHGFFGHR